MDAGQDHLLIARGCQLPHLGYNLIRSAAADASAGVWDNAVAAELVAAILNLQKGSGMIRNLVDGKALILMSLADFDHMAAVTLIFEIFFQDRNQILLFIVSDDDIYCQIRLQLLCCRLDIAASRNHHGIRILLLSPVQHLSGLAVRDIGYGTGVDNVDIGLFVEGHDLVSGFFQKLLHGLRFIGIYLAAQIVQCCRSHIILLYSPNKYLT